jgi:hypothetical protein
MEIEKDIVRWVHYDNKLNEYQEKMKKLRQEKENLGTHILEGLRVSPDTDKISLPQFSIEALQTKVSCHQSTSYESLNYKFLDKCFTEYFSGDEAKSQQMLQFIKQQRETKTRVSLKRNHLE